MDQATQIALTKQVFAHLDNKTTDRADEHYLNPITVYTDPERLRREKQVLFRQYPLLMGLSCQLPGAGSYLTDDNTGLPILVLRDEAGGVNAFLNVCRHRGAKVANGCGHAGKRLVCPYHAWTYDLQGRLTGIPDQGSFAGLEAEQHGLTPLPAEERDGFIWVLPSPGEALDLDAHLGALGPELAGFGLAGYHHYETRVLNHRFNWKILIDTFLEPYHFGPLHRDTVAPIFFPNLCLFEAFGRHLRETLPRRTIVELRDRPEPEWDLIKHTALIYVLFPNTVFVMQADHAEIWRVYPVGEKADESIIYLEFYIPEPATTDSARRHWDRNMDLTLRTVLDEDFPISEGIQFGFASGAQEHLVLGRNEPALAYFQRQVADAIA